MNEYFLLKAEFLRGHQAFRAACERAINDLRSFTRELRAENEAKAANQDKEDQL